MNYRTGDSASVLLFTGLALGIAAVSFCETKDIAESPVRRERPNPPKLILSIYSYDFNEQSVINKDAESNNQ